MDKKLSFLIVLIMAELTYMPEKDAENYVEMIDFLRNYKHAVLAPDVIPTLTQHLSDCLQSENKDPADKNAQMIELIIVIFKNLLQIPKFDTAADSAFSLALLRKFQDDSVLDAFVYLTLKFDSDFSKKLSYHFLEIFYHIFKDY
jgi:hypothetical protein